MKCKSKVFHKDQKNVIPLDFKSGLIVNEMSRCEQ